MTTFSSGRERTKALGVWSGVGGAGAAVGVLLGGVLSELVGWRAIFFINLPIGAIVAIGVAHYVSADSGSPRWQGLDLQGAVLATASFAALVFAPRTVADLERYLQMTSERPASGLLLQTSNGTPYNRTSAATSVTKPLVAQTNVVLAERNQPALPDGVTAHALRKTYFTFLHEAGAPPRWVADQGGHSDPSTSLRIYTESLRGRERGHHGEAFDALLNGAGGPSVEPPSLPDDAEEAGTKRR